MPNIKRSSTRARRTGLFWDKVNKDGCIPVHRPDLGQCWLWTAGLTKKGYGQFNRSRFPGKSALAHRFAYQELVGDIPDRLVLDHLCRTRHCVNPAHLEVVTIGTNVLRGDTIATANASKTHCSYGHRLPGDNLKIYRATKRYTYRVCNACQRRRNAKRYIAHQ